MDFKANEHQNIYNITKPDSLRLEEPNLEYWELLINEISNQHYNIIDAQTRLT